MQRWRRRVVAAVAALWAAVGAIEVFLSPLLHLSLWEAVVVLGTALGAVAIVVSVPRLHDESERPLVVALSGVLLLAAVALVAMPKVRLGPWTLLVLVFFAPSALGWHFGMPRKKESEELPPWEAAEEQRLAEEEARRVRETDALRTRYGRV